MNIKKNDIIELEITDLNNLGCGVGKTDDGVVVFVKGAVTGILSCNADSSTLIF